MFDLETVVLWLVAFLLGRSFILGEVLPFAAAFAAAFASKTASWPGIPLFNPGSYYHGGRDLPDVRYFGHCRVSFLPQFMALREPRRWVALPLLTLSIMVVTKTLFLLL